MKLIALSGSLRAASFNTALLRAASGLCPEGVTLTVHTLQGIPLYDGDLEAQGVPPAVTALREAIKAADGLVIGTPEYNNSIPGVLKNGLDWLSRPPAEGRFFAGKPVAIMGASQGGFGTIQSQDALLSVLRAFAVDFWMGGRLMVSRAQNLFDAQGQLNDEALREQLRAFMQGFAAHVRRGQGG